MRVIGVVDLTRGMAVHARGGVRERYQPVDVPGRSRGDAGALADFYSSVGVEELYIADLDAIGGSAPQYEAMAALSGRCRRAWVDAAIASRDDAAAMLRTGAARVVIGLETLPSAGALDELGRIAGNEVLAFSLDVRHGEPVSRCRDLAVLAPEEIARRAAGAGLTTIILLDVARVGLTTGPDWDLLQRVRAAVPAASLIVGGGIQGAGDLRAAAGAGCQGVLAASALLAGRIGADEIHAVSRL